MSDTNQQPLQVTKNINQWLQRAGLSQDDLQRMSVQEQASVGRQWESYNRDVAAFQANSGITEHQPPNYAMVSHYAIPKLDSPVPQKQERVTYDEWSQRGQERIRKHVGYW